MSAKQASSESINTKMSRALSADEILAGKEIKKVSSAAFSNWVRALLQNWRQGTVAVKGRAEVTYSGKKPWKQKGTGRARAGTRRSPLWRGGGVIFGPQKRVKKLKVSKKLKGRVLLQLLDEFLRNGKIVQLDWRVPEDKPSTKQAVKTLKEVNLIGEKVTLFLPHDDMVTRSSFFNIPTVKIISFDEANAFDLSSAEYWVFLKKDLDLFKKMVEKWI